jgi:hypothetical protein
MKKEMKFCGVILLSIVIVSLLAGHVLAQGIIIDTEKGVPGFWTEPVLDLPANCCKSGFC